MNVEFYDDARATVVEMLDEFGQPIIVTRAGSGGGVYNPETGQIEGGTAAVSYAGLGLPVRYEQSDIDGTLIRQDDRRLYVAANIAIVPQTGDTITLFDGKVLGVVTSAPFSPAGIIVFYEIQCRGS